MWHICEQNSDEGKENQCALGAAAPGDPTWTCVPTEPVTVNAFIADPVKKHSRQGGGWVKAMEEDG